MIHVTTQDDVTFTGVSPVEVVRAMKAVNWNYFERKQEYMLEVAERVEQITGKPLLVPPATLNAGGFLLYLEHAGLITIRVERPRAHA